MTVPALRAALRIARRDATRARGRSILVIAMIGLPILALSTADVLARTAELSPTESLNRELGAADARIQWTEPGTTIEQDPRGLNYGWGSPDPESQNATPTQQSKPSEAEFRKALPPGSTIVSRRLMNTGIRTSNGVKTADLIAFDYSAPTVRGLVRQLSGRAPRTTSEVALTHRLADATGLRVGDTMSLTRPQETDYLIVGLVDDPYHLKAETAFTLPDRKPGATEWYVDTPTGLSWPDVMALNAKGYAATSRQVVLHPPPRSAVPFFRHHGLDDSGAQGQTIAAAVLAAGMALLEVVLLAGPAFAVGARRRRRELALVAATGGDRRDVRNIVLAGGAVLGSAAAVVGVLGGIGLAAALLPTLERLSGSVAGHFDIRPLELGGIALLGVLTGLIAALLPARAAARQDVVAALAGRRGTVRTPTRLPVIGLVVAIAGAVLAIGGAAVLQNVTAVLAGAIISEIGLIMCTPTLLGWAGRLGRRLPLSPRLALRDAARNRSSATPAVAAIMAAVAGSVGIGIVVSSLSAHDKATYQPTLPYRAAAVYLSPDKADLGPEVAAAVRRTLSTREVAIIRSEKPCTSSNCNAFDVVLPPDLACPADSAKSDAEYRRLSKDPRCANRAENGQSYLAPVAVDDGATLPLLSGVAAQEGVAALRAGKAVVFDRRLVQNGKATFANIGSADTKEYHLPAVAITAKSPLVRAVVPSTLARQLKMTPADVAVFAQNRSLPTEEQEQALQGALDSLGAEAGITIERGYVDRYNIGLLALVIGAGVITLGAATIATSLANVDSRPDLVTLAAVGASPRVRRVLSMSRAGVIAVLGSGLGVLAGFLPAVGFILVQRAVETAGEPRPLAIPWLTIGLTAIVVPLLAVGIAGLFSRSRLPIERRMAT